MTMRRLLIWIGIAFLIFFYQEPAAWASLMLGHEHSSLAAQREALRNVRLYERVVADRLQNPAVRSPSPAPWQRADGPGRLRVLARSLASGPRTFPALAPQFLAHPRRRDAGWRSAGPDTSGPTSDSSRGPAGGLRPFRPAHFRQNHQDLLGLPRRSRPCPNPARISWSSKRSSWSWQFVAGARSCDRDEGKRARGSSARHSRAGLTFRLRAARPALAVRQPLQALQRLPWPSGVSSSGSLAARGSAPGALQRLPCRSLLQDDERSVDSSVFSLASRAGSVEYRVNGPSSARGQCLSLQRKLARPRSRP